jgi:NTP pyrophosphatase (non-canonical NTP hydrolase)
MRKASTRQEAFRTYARKTNQAIAYAEGSGRTFGYLKDGLVEELCELDEVVTTSPANFENVMRETGDVFWYVAQTYDHFLGGVPELEQTVSVTPYGTIHTAQQSLRSAIHEVGKISRQAAKAHRDDLTSGLSERRSRVVLEHLEQIYYHMVRFVRYHGFELQDVFDSNLEKLFDRRDRGVLQGEGDHR